MSHRLRSSCCCDFEVIPPEEEQPSFECFLGYGTVPHHQFNPEQYNGNWPGGTDNCDISKDGKLYGNTPNQNIYDKWSGCGFPMNDEVILTLERNISPDYGHAGEYGWATDQSAPGGSSNPTCGKALCDNPCDPEDDCYDCCPEDYRPSQPDPGCCSLCDDDGPQFGECAYQQEEGVFSGDCTVACSFYRCLGIEPPSFESKVDTSYDPEQRQPIYVRYRKPVPGVYSQIDWQNHVGKITERPYVYRFNMAAQWFDGGYNSSNTGLYNYGRGYNGGHRLWPLWANPNGPSNLAGIPCCTAPVPNDPLMPHGTAHCAFGDGGNGGKWNRLYGKMSDYISSTSGNIDEFFYFDGDINRRGLYNFPLTWAQSMLIGLDWNTNSGGFLPIVGKLQGKNCETPCPEDDNPDAPRPYGGYIREWGPTFFWLQGIADVNTEVSTEERGWYLNFWWLNGQVRPYYKNGGFGDDPCESGFPYGLSPLNETLFGVFHKEAYYERYWTGFRTDNYARIHGVAADTEVGKDDNGDPILGYPYEGVAGKVPGGRYFAISEETWNEKGKINSPGNIPRAIGFRCAGTPVFTWELEKLFVGGNGLGPATIPNRVDGQSWEDLGLESIASKLTMIQSNILASDKIPGLSVNISAAIATAIARDGGNRRLAYRDCLWICAITGHAFPAEVTDVLELYGVLPEAQNWGETQDYKIFKKNMYSFEFDGEPEENPEHEGCCLNVGENNSDRLWGSCAFTSEELYQLSYGTNKTDLCELLIPYVLDFFGEDYLDEIPECFDEEGFPQAAYLKDIYPEFYQPVKDEEGNIIVDESGNPRFFHSCSKTECAEVAAEGFCTFWKNGIPWESKLGQFHEVEDPENPGETETFDCGCCSLSRQAARNPPSCLDATDGGDCPDGSNQAAEWLVKDGITETTFTPSLDNEHCTSEIALYDVEDNPDELTPIGFNADCVFAAEQSLDNFYKNYKLESPCENESICVNVPWGTCQSIYGGQLAEGAGLGDNDSTGITCPSIKPFNVDPENQGYCSPYGAIDEPPDGLANNEERFGNTAGICCTIAVNSASQERILVECTDIFNEEECEFANKGPGALAYPDDPDGPLVYEELAVEYPSDWKGDPGGDQYPYCYPKGQLPGGAGGQCERTFSVSRNCLNNAFACGSSSKEWVPQQPDNVGGCEIWGSVVEKEQYFYGRPGGWFHICNFEAIVSDDPLDGVIRESIRVGSGANFLPNRFSTCGPCWSSGAFIPLKMIAELDNPLLDNPTWGPLCCSEAAKGNQPPNSTSCFNILFTACVGYKGRPNPWITNSRFNPVYNMSEPAPQLAEGDEELSDKPPSGEGVALDYDGIFQPCGNESFTETCRGIWWQFHANDYETQPGVGYACGCDTVNNAFWLRTDPYQNDNTPSIASWYVDPTSGLTGITWNNDLSATRGVVHIFNLQNLSDEDSEFYQSIKTPDYTHLGPKCVFDGACTNNTAARVTVKSKGFRFLLSASEERSEGFIPDPFAVTGDAQIPLDIYDDDVVGEADAEELRELFENALNDESNCGGSATLRSTQVLKVLYNEYTRFFEKIVTADNAADIGVTFDEGKKSRVFSLNAFEQLDFQEETAAPDTLYYQIVEELEYRQNSCPGDDDGPYVNTYYYSRSDIPGFSGTVSINNGESDGCVDGVKLKYSGQAARNTEYQWYHQPFIQVTGQPARAYTRAEGAFCKPGITAAELPNKQCLNERATYAPTTLTPNANQCNFTMQEAHSYGPNGRQAKMRG